MAGTTQTRKRLDRRTRAARRDGRDAREDLFDAAIEVVAERGFRQASVDEIAARAGLSKGAVYWHFASKEDLFFALLEERLDRAFIDGVALLASAPPEQDMSVEASSRFVEVMRRQRYLVLVENEYWAMAVRDPKLRRRYARRQEGLRRGLAEALQARVEHLGGPSIERDQAEGLATLVMSLIAGLAQERMISPSAVPDDLLGEALALLYRGLVERGATRTAGSDGSAG
jgi:AcrR family transcriptional regulator